MQEVADYLGAEASDQPGPQISGAKPLEFAGEEDITYVAARSFLKKFEESRAAAVLISPDMDPGGRPCIRTPDPEVAFARVTALFYAYETAPAGVSKFADAHPEAKLGQDVSVGAFSVIGRGSAIGDRTVVSSNVAIGEDVHIGADCRIFPNVTVYPRVTIGDRVIIHSGTVIGSDGFGFARDPQRGEDLNVKKYHSGTVEIGDDVEIGALCAVDRALAGVTRLGRGVKLDNFVQVAHSVQIGAGTVIAAQSGIAGSSSVGRLGVIAGQVGIRDHVAVGNQVTLATRVGIYRNVPDNAVMGGSVPAMPYNVFLRTQSLFKRLPEIMERIRNLESLLKSNDKEK